MFVFSLNFIEPVMIKLSVNKKNAVNYYIYWEAKLSRYFGLSKVKKVIQI